jgi:methylated-DNA-[protein]-cysteine S-methyltransferase
MVECADTVAFGSVPTEMGDVLAAVTTDGLVATAFTDSPHIRAAIAGSASTRTVPTLARRGFWLS